MPTEHIYLGQSSGRIGEWISQLPVIGAPLGVICEVKRTCARKALNTAWAILLRWLSICFPAGGRTSFCKMLCKPARLSASHHRPRYPQVGAPGFRFDGPQLAKTTGGNGWIKMLRQRAEAVPRMASYLPVLLIRLGIDEQTAFARKPDHQLAALQEKSPLRRN